MLKLKPTYYACIERKYKSRHFVVVLKKKMLEFKTWGIFETMTLVSAPAIPAC